MDELSQSLGRAEPEILREVQQLEEEGRLFLRRGYVVGREKMEGIRQQVLSILRDFHRLHPLKEGISKEELRGLIDAPGALVEDTLATLEEVQVQKNVVRQRGQEIHYTPEQEGQRQRIEAAFLQAGLSPPSRSEVLAQFDPKIFYALVRQGILVALTEDIYLHRSALEKAKEDILREMSRRPQMRLSEMKDVWGTTRKFAVPLAEYLDRIGFTQRVGEQRELAKGR
jgi:selenocysteine-specific elongation factor